MARLRERVAIVTGGASGIGRSCVAALRAEGAVVVVGDVTPVEPEEGLHHRETDVSDEAEVAALVDFAVKTCGGLDFMVNNAGIPGRRSPVAETDCALARHDMNVLFHGALHGTKHAAAALNSRGGGCIVNIASVAGLTAG